MAWDNRREMKSLHLIAKFQYKHQDEYMFVDRNANTYRNTVSDGLLNQKIKVDFLDTGFCMAFSFKIDSV